MNLKHYMLSRSVLALFFALTACGEVESDQPAQKEQLKEIASDRRFQAVQDQLANQGDDLDMSKASLYQEGDLVAAIVPVVGETSEYSALVYQKMGKTHAMVSLELSGRSPAGTEHNALYQCSTWSEWRTVVSFCQEFHISCFGRATMLTRERHRTCYSAGASWTENQHDDVRNRCGC